MDIPTIEDKIEEYAGLPTIVPRFSWEVRMSSHFLLHYHIEFSDADDALFDELLSECEKIYDEIVQFLEIKLRSKQEEILAQTRLIFFTVKTRCNGSYGGFRDNHTLFFLFDPKHDPRYMTRIRHEITHWVWGRLYGEAPPLFQEGIADYAEIMSATSANVAEFLETHSMDIEPVPPLCELALTENFWKHNEGLHQNRYNLMYQVGGLWIQFLVEKWGWDKLRSLFLISDYKDSDIVENFAKVYGKTLADVDVQWRREILERLNLSESAIKSRLH